VTVVDQYQVQTEALAATTERQALVIYAALQAGKISLDTAVQLVATLINRSNAAATTLADVFLALQIEQGSGEPTPAVGLLPRDDADRLVKAANTILAAPEPAGGEPDQPTMRLQRLAHSEPLETAQYATHDAMQQQPLVEGWTRAMDADPCQLCRWWWREGRIWPKEHPFQSHKGCNCQPKVVLAKSIRSTGYTRRLERNRAPSGTLFDRFNRAQQLRRQRS
jgi:hypothetical protein